ncbi:NADH oxidase [Desulfamplus magnetovallimortis]|uniref:NADH oxidase n=1 Tax=Desulfamplus magnetovallimortis TaxID=1246637 RepID=A0A1W1HE30_9BACT|nr:NADH:flavin oxidoreductase/NADH oxidase family protein [Desulfamplus magnetovallimortis]SLM30751.1 NADH oxidase [Desulfamplus magnetovallimortis]
MTNSNQNALKSPLKLKNGVTIKNRLFKSAMSEQLGDNLHNPSYGLVRLYDTWAKGGIGLSVTGNVMVDRFALGEPKNVVLDEKSYLSMFEQWAEAGKRDDTQLWIQLNHPGKQSPKFLTKEPVAPSAVPLGKGFDKTFNTPRELTEQEIFSIIQKFAISAGLAKRVGFSGVQIHGAHGYLISQFLSPHHNRRTDGWGGSLENRMRFVLEVFRAIRKTVGESYPVGIKLNSADFMKSGFTHEESMAVVKQLEKEGIDLVEISGGTYESPSMTGYKVKDSTRKREAYFLEYAEKVRKEIDVPFVVTGGFRSGAAMISALESGATDMIGIARPLAVMPDFPNRLMDNEIPAIHFDDPTTGFKAVDRMTLMSILWYEFQIERIAKGKAPDPALNAWRVVFQAFARMGIYGFSKRRG